MNLVLIVLPVDEIFVYCEEILSEQLRNNHTSQGIPVLVVTGWEGIWPNEVKSQFHH